MSDSKQAIFRMPEDLISNNIQIMKNWEYLQNDNAELSGHLRKHVTLCEFMIDTLEERQKLLSTKMVNIDKSEEDLK